LKSQKDSLLKGLRSILEEVESAREYRNNQLKSIQELESANNELKLEQEKLDRQKASLATEIHKCKECLDDAKDQLISFQEHVDKLKQEEQQLTSRIQRLNHEELEILRLMEGQRRSKQLEQSIQESQKHPQLVYQQPVQQEMPNLSDEELRILAIPLICSK
jgi:chromosome segregation ATPase